MSSPIRRVRALRAIDPASEYEGPIELTITDGRISGRETDASKFGAADLIVDQGFLLPGLIDAHAHPSLSGSRYGVDPDQYFLPRGSTTVLSQGDAGARNIDEFVDKTIEPSRTRIKLAINFCANGESNPNGRFFDLDEASIFECVEAIERHREHIWGISLNVAFVQNPSIDPLDIMRRGVEAGEQANVRILFGATKTDATPLADQLALLRPGDSMTYCFHSGEGSIVQAGRIQDCVLEARERGVLFDVGDGFAAFGFDTAETAISEGFLPDIISSDAYVAHVESGTNQDLPLVASKLVAAGMSIEDCWSRMTSATAKLLGLEDENGQLRVGAAADFCVVDVTNQTAQLRDGHNQTRTGQLWEPVLTIKAGEVVSQ